MHAQSRVSILGNLTRLTATARQQKGCRVSGFRVQGTGLRVEGLRVSGLQGAGVVDVLCWFLVGNEGMRYSVFP